jgi:hypothetical protein
MPSSGDHCWKSCYAPEVRRIPRLGLVVLPYVAHVLQDANGGRTASGSRLMERRGAILAVGPPPLPAEGPRAVIAGPGRSGLTRVERAAGGQATGKGNTLYACGAGSTGTVRVQR